MAINEAAANVIRHTYGEHSDARLALELRRFPDRLEFLVEDWGPKVRAEQIRPRPLDEVRPGGLGTLFINTYMDVCVYDPEFPEGNRLKMVKYFPRKGALGDESPSPTSG
jgi:anti-sigma regulatory factor (Ser/Thr protein kinase)